MQYDVYKLKIRELLGLAILDEEGKLTAKAAETAEKLLEE